MSSSDLTIDSTLPLPNTDLRIPLLGFGVYLSPPETCVQSCLSALRAGYRHIDTAQYYGNETSVGRAIKQSGLPRSELFITTKILFPGSTAEETYASILDSVRKISDPDGEGQDVEGYVDLFLIHTPSGGPGAVKMMWQAIERAHKEGKTRTIGVSNFGIGHIESLRSYATIFPPAVNQIELHPWCQQRKIVDYCRSKGIVIEAYCPLVRNQKAGDPALRSVCEKVGKTEGQVLIRWSLQRGWVPLPKSDDEGRIRENKGVFGWALGSEEMAVLDGLDEGAEGAIVQAVKNE